MDKVRPSHGYYATTRRHFITKATGITDTHLIDLEKRKESTFELPNNWQHKIVDINNIHRMIYIFRIANHTSNWKTQNSMFLLVTF